MQNKRYVMLTGVFILSGCAGLKAPQPSIKSDKETQNTTLISKLQKTETKAIIEKNNINAPMIEYSGSTVTEAINAAQTENVMTGNSNETLSMQAANAPGSDANTPMIYKVEIGDSLYSIARKNKISIVCLAKANKITDPNKLAAGQALVIPKASDC